MGNPVDNVAVVGAGQSFDTDCGPGPDSHVAEASDRLSKIMTPHKGEFLILNRNQTPSELRASVETKRY